MPSLNQRIRIRTRSKKATNPNAKYKIVIHTSNVSHTVNGQVVRNTSTTTREIVPNVDSQEN